MTAPSPNKPRTGTGKKIGFAAAPALVVLAIVAALQPSEKRVLTTYWDHLGKIDTVCAGVTGPGVIRGKTYTVAECEAMETAYVQKMLARMGSCVTAELEFHEVKAWGHFAYNVGTANFCRSTAARLLNQGKSAEACKQISRWTFVKGKDCRLKANKCGGIVKRRATERAWCEGIS